MSTKGLPLDARLALAFQRFDQAEVGLCRYLNRPSTLVAVRTLFRVVSWLGNGWLWYAWIAALPLLYGRDGGLVAVQMAITGGLGVLLYKAIKERAVRERPFITHSAIHCAAAPLDRYSFPSGHTLHAVCFTSLSAVYFPEWGPLLVAFATLVAMSRVLLGLHYPTDVAAGALLGGALATASVYASRLLGF